nr:MAG TPA: hypothetical protein [Caudoviricetes sp.]
MYFHEAIVSSCVMYIHFYLIRHNVINQSYCFLSYK